MATAAATIGATACVLLFAAGATGVAYGRWTQPIAAADQALAAGNTAAALTAYDEAESRFDAIPVLRQLAAADYHRVAGNRLWLLYQLERHDDLIAAAERAPEEASPHFWAGLAFFAKARREVAPGQQLGWLTRAEDELRRAVEAEPADWNAKYDFELVTRLTRELTKAPKTPPRELLQLLRPQPDNATRPPRRVG